MATQQRLSARHVIHPVINVWDLCIKIVLRVQETYIYIPMHVKINVLLHISVIRINASNATALV